MTGVDYLSVGGSLALPSSVPARPLGEAFRRLTEIYKRILIIGPTLSQALETELLAGYADAVLITLAGAGRPVSGEAEKPHSLLEGDERSRPRRGYPALTGHPLR